MRNARRLALLTTAAVSFLLAGAATASAQDASTSMTAISNLFWVVAILAVAIGLFVGIILVITVLKFRMRNGRKEADPNPKTSNHALEAAWTIVPAIILLILGMLAFQTLAFTDTLPQHPDVYVDAIGHQWFWEFWVNYTNGTHVHYPSGGFTVPANMTVLMNVTSVDVDHSLFIPDLGVHMDAIPGHLNQVWFKATMPGDYHIECTQFCGLNHYQMVGTLVVTP